MNKLFILVKHKQVSASKKGSLEFYMYYSSREKVYLNEKNEENIIRNKKVQIPQNEYTHCKHNSVISY